MYKKSIEPILLEGVTVTVFILSVICKQHTSQVPIKTHHGHVCTLFICPMPFTFIRFTHVCIHDSITMTQIMCLMCCTRWQISVQILWGLHLQVRESIVHNIQHLVSKMCPQIVLMRHGNKCDLCKYTIPWNCIEFHGCHADIFCSNDNAYILIHKCNVIVHPASQYVPIFSISSVKPF